MIYGNRNGKKAYWERLQSKQRSGNFSMFLLVFELDSQLVNGNNDVDKSYPRGWT